MKTLHPVEELKEEHRAIEEMLDQLEQQLAESDDAAFPIGFVEQALDFFRNFADGVHHFKEEEALFPLLAARGVAVEGGPIGVMLDEHRIGRDCLKGIREQIPAAHTGSREARQKIREYAAAYTDMLRRHIWKEDNVLFEIAKRALAGADLEKLVAKMHDPSNPNASAAIRERYMRMLQPLTTAPRS